MSVFDRDADISLIVADKPPSVLAALIAGLVAAGRRDLAAKAFAALPDHHLPELLELLADLD